MTGLVHGKKTTKKGYFEGLKIGVLSILILYIINFIFYNPNYNLKLLTYYSIIALFNVLGGMIGKAQKKETINK